MGFREREARRITEQERVLKTIIDTLTSSKTELLAPEDRRNLHGSRITINHHRNTLAGVGVIKEVDFTITDGTTLQWDEELQAAIAYGLMQGQNEMVCTGGIFETRKLQTLNLDAQNISDFPSLIYEIPGHFNTFGNGVAFRIHPTSPYTWSLNFGTSMVQNEIPFPTPQLLNTRRNNPHTISTYLERVVKVLLPHK